MRKTLIEKFVRTYLLFYPPSLASIHQGDESMRLVLAGLVAMIFVTGAAIGAKETNAPEPGIYTNEEEVYFDALAKRPVAPWMAIRVEAQQSYVIGPFGDVAAGVFDVELKATPEKDRIFFPLPDGKVTELRRARPVTCWVAIRKDKPKADGSEDWYFAHDVKLHDQGGRALVGGFDTGAEPVMIRVRNVTWDKGSTNAPVISLYIHKPENWDKAESYSWAAPDSGRVGINLRWVQTGCAIEGLGAPSKLDPTTFKTNEEAKTKK
jgi:hypothetical protein